jgi:hypothetical protein
MVQTLTRISLRATTCSSTTMRLDALCRVRTMPLLDSADSHLEAKWEILINLEARRRTPKAPIASNIMTTSFYRGIQRFSFSLFTTCLIKRHTSSSPSFLSCTRQKRCIPPCSIQWPRNTSTKILSKLHLSTPLDV